MKKARVTEEHKTNYVIYDGEREFTATVRGSFFVEKKFPKVGDYIMFNDLTKGKAVIEEILPRTSEIIRKDEESGVPQVIVVNVDIIFIVMGLDNDFNISRLERYLLLAKQSGVKAVVVLNKCDTADNSSTYIDQTKEISGIAPVHVVSALTNQNMEALLTYLTPSTTAVLLGSSGAGKSTITNWLLEKDSQKVSSVREGDNRGRHTTTSRQLFRLNSGACLIDTPGMRELGVLDSTRDDENSIFLKIGELSSHCKFSNCDHEKSEGCAIKEAISLGELSERHVTNYHKLQRSRLFEESKRSEALSNEQKNKLKKLRRNYNEKSR
jgi:ribosome biogenesis GTPase